MITNCIISGNKAGNGGGGIFSDSTDYIITNCIISGNEAGVNGSGIYSFQDSPKITNCTISGGYEYSILIYCHSSFPVMKNSILWGCDVNGKVIGFEFGGITVTYSDVEQNGYGNMDGSADANNNIRKNPLFVNAAGGDYRLTSGSPCIDTGTDQDAPDSDILNVPRPQGNGFDMGAYEFLKHPPVANAGPDQTVERTSVAGAQVQLDGSGSSDPDGDPLTYEWTWSGGSASGVNPIVTLPPGLTTVTLTVSDGELTATDTVDITVVDTTPPVVNIVFPQPNAALQDGVIFAAEASDLSGIDKVYFYVREPDGGNGTPIGYEDLEATFNSTTGKWEYNFDTTVLQDGYYVILAKAIDNAGNEGLSAVVPFSIRNWAVIEKLPSTPNSKAGRTMPIKFSLRIAASVDSAQPFVYNEDLEIRIYRCDNTSCSSKTRMQTSVYGTNSTDYKIDLTAQLYQTNFQTTKTPSQYLVEIWRPSNNFMVESFTFKTFK